MGLGVAVHIKDPKVCGVIVPRSGLGSKHGIVPNNLVGLIDSDYTGELKATVWNHDKQHPYTVSPYERIFQIVFMPVVDVELVQVDDFKLQTDRGSKGFGSTGTH